MASKETLGSSSGSEEKPIRLDVGGGLLDQNKIDRYKRYVGEDYDPSRFTVIDVTALSGVNLVCDLAQGLPLASGSVDEVICVHVLEHINDLKAIMKEIHRVLKPGGILKIWVPHCFSPIAFGDSTHVRFFTFETLSQFDKNSPGSYYYDFHFELIQSRMQIFRRWYKVKWFDKILESLVNRRQRKGERFLKILPYKEWEVYTEFRKEV
jgi:predicted SAM-dependent methyltransferase